MDAAWVGVAGALGGVVLTGVIGVVTAVLSHRWQREDQQTTRIEARREARAELRRNAYAEFLVALNLILEETGTWMAAVGRDIEDPAERWGTWERNPPEATSRYDVAERHARLLASSSVDVALEAFKRWFSERFVEFVVNDDRSAFQGHPERESALIDVMRQELDSDLRLESGTQGVPDPS